MSCSKCFVKHKNTFTLSIISWQWNGAGSWNPSSWQTRPVYPTNSTTWLLITCYFSVNCIFKFQWKFCSKSDHTNSKNMKQSSWNHLKMLELFSSDHFLFSYLMTPSSASKSSAASGSSSKLSRHKSVIRNNTTNHWPDYFKSLEPSNIDSFSK